MKVHLDKCMQLYAYMYILTDITYMYCISVLVTIHHFSGELPPHRPSKALNIRSSSWDGGRVAVRALSPSGMYPLKFDDLNTLVLIQNHVHTCIYIYIYYFFKKKLEFDTV